MGWRRCKCGDDAGTRRVAAGEEYREEKGAENADDIAP